MSLVQRMCNAMTMQRETPDDARLLGGRYLRRATTPAPSRAAGRSGGVGGKIARAFVSHLFCTRRAPFFVPENFSPVRDVAGFAGGLAW